MTDETKPPVDSQEEKPDNNNPEKKDSIEKKAEELKKPGEESVAAEVLDDLKPDEKTFIERSMSMVLSQRGPMHDLVKKITSGHIDTVLLNSDNEDKRDRKERGAERWFKLGYYLLAVIVVGGLIIIFKNDREILSQLIIGILAFLGGLGLGFSVGRNR